MKKTLSLVLASLLVVVLVSAGFSQEKKAAKKAGSKPAGAMVDVVEMTAVVDAVDAGNRTVTLKAPDGATRTFKVGPEVKNFDQIKAGDKVKTTFYESVAILVAKAGEKPSASGSQTVEVAPKGAKPGAVVVDTLEVTATVEKINYKKRTLSLKGPEGNVRTFTVDKSVKNFKNIKKGDDIYLRVTEAVAMVVEK
jgi:translation elongation factor P/translation initiation factor 5A